MIRIRLGEKVCDGNGRKVFKAKGYCGFGVGVVGLERRVSLGIE